jgi:hypothetical protein
MLKLFKKEKAGKFNIEACIAGSVESMQLMNATHKEQWRLGQEQSWKVDEAAGLIVFGFADGVEVAAPVQVIGTFHAGEQSFLWAWDHPAVTRNLHQHALKVKAFGEEHAAEELTSRQVACTEKRAWEYTALAMLLAEANGAYRAKVAPETYAFMTFGATRTRVPA